METIEQLVRAQIAKELENNEYFREAEDKEAFLTSYMDNHVKPSKLLKVIDAAVVKWYEQHGR